MSEIMKGNFKPQKEVEIKKAEDDLTAQFERAALKRLGGSIAFVSKKKFLYGAGEEENKADLNEP